MFDMEEREAPSSAAAQAGAGSGVFAGLVSAQVVDMVTGRFEPICQWVSQSWISVIGGREKRKKTRWKKRRRILAPISRLHQVA